MSSPTVLSNGAKVSPHVSAREMLQAVIAGKMTQEEFANLVAGQIEAARANGRGPRAIRFEVSAKTGAIIARGLGRFPTTLYYSQWDRIFAPETAQQFRQFAQEQKGKYAEREDG